MRVLAASAIFPPDAGGPATHLAHVVPELAGRGHDVHVLTFGDETVGDRQASVTRVSFRQGRVMRLVRFAEAYRRLARTADVVYAATLGLPRLGPRRPTVLRVPGDPAWERSVNASLVPPQEDIDRFQTTWHAPWVEGLKWLRAREARGADRVLVPSHYLGRLVTAWGVDPRRVRVVHSAVAPPLRSAGASLTREAARHQLRWAPSRRVVLTVARLTAWKGVDLLIDAVAATPGVSLVVAGDGPVRSALEARASASGAAVEFVGALRREALVPYVAASDYVALYSGYEGLSHVLVEALQTGTPVIASNRGGNPEVVRHGFNGLLVDHPDPAALVAALTQAFTGDTRARLARGAAQGVDGFAWRDVAPVLVHEIESVVGRVRER